MKLYVKIELASDLKSKVLPHAVVFGLYFSYAHLLGRVLESVFLYVAYLSIRKLFPKHFHADYIPGINADLIGVTCVCLSTTTLCAALFQTTAISFSIFNTIFVAAVVDFLLYMARDWLDMNKDKPLFIKLKSYFLRDKQLDARLLCLGFNKTHRTVAIEHVVNEQTMSEISAKLNLSEQTCKNYFQKVLKAAPDLKKKTK